MLISGPQNGEKGVPKVALFNTCKIINISR